MTTSLFLLRCGGAAAPLNTMHPFAAMYFEIAGRLYSFGRVGNAVEDVRAYSVWVYIVLLLMQVERYGFANSSTETPSLLFKLLLLFIHVSRGLTW